MEAFLSAYPIKTITPSNGVRKMKEITKYKDEISNRIFDTAEKAIASEKKNGGIKRLFAFWIEPPRDDTCQFANGGWCYQRTEEDVQKFKDALVKAIRTYEPWIASQYDEDGGFQEAHIGAGYLIGRYLSDGQKELYSQYCTLSCICSKCFREWGQQYHATHCRCSAVPNPL